MSYVDTAKKVQNTIFSKMVDGNIRVENAVIMYRNFSGRPTDFNPQGGKRTFNLCLNAEWADILRNDGWNIRVRPLDDGDMIYSTEIVVNENSQYPPHLYLLSEFMGKKTLTLLQPEQYYKLDQDIIVGLDLEIHPFEHGRGTPGSKKGYLKNLWATLQSVNDFGGKYAGYEMANAGV